MELEALLTGQRLLGLFQILSVQEMLTEACHWQGMPEDQAAVWLQMKLMQVLVQELGQELVQELVQKLVQMLAWMLEWKLVVVAVPPWSGPGGDVAARSPTSGAPHSTPCLFWRSLLSDGLLTCMSTFAVLPECSCSIHICASRASNSVNPVH